MRRTLAVLATLASVVACAPKAPPPEPVPETRDVQLADIEAPIKPGDCQEALRRAATKPDLDVEKVPAPLAMNPGPIDTKKMPKGVADKNGYYAIHFHVLIDTAGKADMKTFVVDTTTNAWLGTSVKSAVAKWTFAPAMVAGCKVPRNYSLGISPRGKTPAAPAKAAPAKTPPKKPPVE